MKTLLIILLIVHVILIIFGFLVFRKVKIKTQWWKLVLVNMVPILGPAFICYYFSAVFVMNQTKNDRERHLED